MSQVNIRSILEIIGVMAVITGLGSVGFELRQSNDIAYAEITTWMEESRLITHQATIENAEVWQKGCSGAELRDDQKVIFEYLIRNEIVIMFYRWLRADQFERILNEPHDVVVTTVTNFETCGILKTEFMKRDPTHWTAVATMPFVEAIREEINRRGT